MKRRRFSFLALLVLAVILLMPVTIQAASAPGTVKLNSILAPAYNKINVTMPSLYAALMFFTIAGFV